MNSSTKETRSAQRKFSQKRKMPDRNAADYLKCFYFVGFVYFVVRFFRGILNATWCHNGPRQVCVVEFLSFPPPIGMISDRGIEMLISNIFLS